MLVLYYLNLLILFIALLLSLIMVSRTWQYRTKSLGIYAFILMSGLSFWFVSRFIQQTSSFLPVQIIAMKVSYLGISAVPLAWFAFIIRYTNTNRIITRATELVTIAFLAILPLATQVIIWTNDHNHFMWKNFGWDYGVFPPLLHADFNFWYWIYITYLYAVFCAGVIFLFFYLIQLKGEYRKQARAVLLIGALSWACNILHVVQIGPFKILDLMPLAYSVPAFYFFFVLDRIKLLDVVPIAHDTIFNNIGDGVIVLDELDNVVDLNSASESIFKLKKRDIMGQPYTSVFGEYTGLPPLKPDLQEARAAIILGKEAQRHYEVRLSPIVLHQHFGGHLLLLHDDTERIKLEAESKERVRLETELFERERANQQLEMKVTERTEQLEEAVAIAKASNQVKARFLTNMSHELRTPLISIIGFSQMLQDDNLGGLNAKQADYINDIADSGQHLLSLINDILDLSRAQAGKMELDKDAVNIKNLLQNSQSIMKDRAQAQNIRMEVQVSKEIEDLEIMVDERRVKQVMLNLLSNAVKFSPDGGTITIQVSRAVNEIIISVADSGIGINPEEQKKIFQEFYQVNNDIKNNTPGTGLGLTICKNIVEQHGGKIWVESEGLKKGSRFIFSLPVQLPAIDD
jgi:signal transduction histidine kinase